MKSIENKFTVELTTAEISYIANALHQQYKGDALLLDDDKEAIRKLRNEMGQLINRFWIGRDA